MNSNCYFFFHLFDIQFGTPKYTFPSISIIFVCLPIKQKEDNGGVGENHQFNNKYNNQHLQLKELKVQLSLSRIIQVNL